MVEHKHFARPKLGKYLVDVSRVRVLEERTEYENHHGLAENSHFQNLCVRSGQVSGEWSNIKHLD